MRERERALEMIKIMIERIKTATTDEELKLRQYRTAGAIFILYFIDIISYDEHEKFQSEIFSRTAF